MMSSAFVTAAPKPRAPRSARRRRKLAASTTTTESNDSSPSTTAGSTPAPSKPAAAPSKPKSIWDKRQAVREAAVAAKAPPQSAPSKPIVKPKPAPFRPYQVRRRRGIEKVDISSEEQFPSLGAKIQKKVEKKKVFHAKKTRAMPYDPDQVGMARKSLPMDCRSVYSKDTRPAYTPQTNKPLPDKLSWRSRYPQQPTSATARSDGPNISIPNLRRKVRGYVPPALRKLAQEQKAKLPVTDPEPVKPTVNKVTCPPQHDPVSHSVQNQEPQTQTASPRMDNPPAATPPSRPQTVPRQPSPQQSPEPVEGEQPERPTAALQHTLKKKRITADLSVGSTKKYLQLLKGSTANIRDAFLIKNERKKMHDVASVKKRLARQIAANNDTQDTTANDYYYSKQEMVDYAVNGDFHSMNDKSVSVSGHHLRSTAESWTPVVAKTFPVSAPGSWIVYAQDGLPATATVPIHPAIPLSVPMANSWNQCTAFTPTRTASNLLTVPFNTYHAPSTLVSPIHNPRTSSIVGVQSPTPQFESVPNQSNPTAPNTDYGNVNINPSGRSPVISAAKSRGPRKPVKPPLSLKRRLERRAKTVTVANDTTHSESCSNQQIQYRNAPHFRSGQMVMMNQFATQNMLMLHSNANVQNQRWIQSPQPQLVQSVNVNYRCTSNGAGYPMMSMPSHSQSMRNGNGLNVVYRGSWDHGPYPITSNSWLKGNGYGICGGIRNEGVYGDYQSESASLSALSPETL